MLDFEYRQIKGVICDILHLIWGLQTAYLQHKNTILAKVFKSSDSARAVIIVVHCIFADLLLFFGVCREVFPSVNFHEQ